MIVDCLLLESEWTTLSNLEKISRSTGNLHVNNTPRANTSLKITHEVQPKTLSQGYFLSISPAQCHCSITEASISDLHSCKQL